MNFLSNRCQIFCWLETFYNFSIFIQQKLCKVPLNLFTFIRQIIAHLWILSQPAINWVGVLSVNFNFLKDRKLDIVILVDKFSDLFFWPWLLTWKLIAWKGKNLQAFVFEVFPNLIQLFIVRICIRTLTGNVDDKKSFAVFELRK